MTQQPEPATHRSNRRNFFRGLFSPTIRLKIVLPYLILTLVIAAIGAYVVTNLVASSQNERLTNQLLEAGRVVSDNMAREEIQHIGNARGIAYIVGLAQALQAGRIDEVMTLAQPTATNMGLECLILFDAAGNESLHLLKASDGTLYPISTRVELADLWIVQTLLEENSPNAFPRRAIGQHPVDGRYYYFTAIPIALDDQLAGVAVVGTRLDTLAIAFKANALADVLLYAGAGEPRASTLEINAAGETDMPLEQLSLSPEQYLHILTTTEVTFGENIIIRERAYRLARAPLQVGNDLLGVFGVVLPEQFILQAGTASRNTYAALFSVATLCVILIGYLISQRITAPLARLVGVSRAVADGALSQRTGIHSADEIGTLAATFDQMTGRLEERTQDLEKLLHVYKEASGRMKAILLSIGDGVILEDLEGHFTPLNPAAETMLEQMSDSFLTYGMHEQTAGIARSLPEQSHGPWLEDQRRFEVGRQAYDIRSASVRTDDGRPLGKVIVLRDVTAEVEAERVKDAFVTHVSHELRTPLTAIKGYTSLLLKQAVSGLGLQLRGFFETIDRNTDDLISMVEELLELSEMESRGYLAIRTRPDTLTPLIDDIAERWRGPMVEKNLRFRIEVPRELPYASVDLRRLRWAVMALVRNAWQYTPEDGEVTLRVDTLEKQLRVHVSDTGRGIQPEELKYLFGRFHRFTGEDFDNVRGLGLGLYITRAIVEAHSGDIQVVSEPGEGSTFTISLPILPPEILTAQMASGGGSDG